MKQLLQVAALLIVGACSPSDGKQAGIGIAGTLAPTLPPTGTAGAPAGAGVGARGQAGMGAATAGRSNTGVPTAGAAIPVAGASGQAAAGTGTARAGAPAAAGGGSIAGTGAAGAGIAGTGAAGMSGGGAAGMGGTSTPGTVTIEFKTVSYGGEYAPLNYGAVWFEDGSGKFIKTAKRWAGAVHATDLVAWTKASGGWGSILGGGNTADMMDAMSSATIRMHQMHTVTWNMMDAQKALIPDGAYVAKLEMSESRARDRAGPVVEIKFTKGAMPMMVEVPNQASFTGIVLRYMP